MKEKEAKKKDLEISISNAMAEAYLKAIDSLSRYKFVMSGYWMGQWVKLNSLLPHPRPNPFAYFVKAAREKPWLQDGSDPNRFYIAARYDRREEMCGYAQELRNLGYTVECRWLLGTHQLHAGAGKIDVDHHPEHGVSQEAAPFAQDDYEDMKASGAIIFFSEPPDSHSKRGGRHVEFGLALAWGKRLIVIGQRENVFHCLPQVERFNTWKEFLDNLSGQLGFFEVQLKEGR